MLNKFELDPQVIEFANKISTVLDFLEEGNIKPEDFSKELNNISDYKNKPLTLGFLFTHMTFYKKDLKTPWLLSEIVEIIHTNPGMLDLLDKQ